MLSILIKPTARPSSIYSSLPELLPLLLPHRLLFVVLQELEQVGGLFDLDELDAECLDFDEQVLHVDDFVSDEAGEEDTDESDESVLHVLVFDVFTSRDAVGDVEMHELTGQVDYRGQLVHHFHAME